MTTIVSLREVTHENLESILDLSVTESQKAVYPRSNARSIAEGHYPADADPVWIRGIFTNETPVGLLMTSEAPQSGEYFLWRIMIDAKHQSKGYAAQAIELLIKRIRETPNAKILITSHLKENGGAGQFFARLGFSYTGEMIGDTDLLMDMTV